MLLATRESICFIHCPPLFPSREDSPSILSRVAYTGIANGSLTMGCVDGGELGGYHVENCTAPDGTLPVTLL